MGIKKRLKKENPERHKVFLALRKADKTEIQMVLNNIPARVPTEYVEHVNSNGNITLLNINKRIMLQKPYKEDVHKQEVIRHIRKASKELEAEKKFRAEHAELMEKKNAGIDVEAIPAEGVTVIDAQ